MKIFGAILIALLALASPALAQNPATVKLCIPTSGTACGNVTATNPLPVSGTFSATLAGFTPNGNYTTLTATAASSASTTLPAGTVVAFQNLSTVDVSCVLTAGASTATTNKLIVRGGATVYYTIGSNTTAACINQTGSASNVVGLAGGSGLGTAFGGGGSGGGGGAVTLAAGAVAAGAYVSGSILSGALADGAIVTLGTIGDTAWVSGNGTAIALLKNIATGIGSAIPDCGATPCTNKIGVVGINTWGGSTLGAGSNYGTSPGAVVVPGVNAFVTGGLAVAAWGQGATGAAPPSGAVYQGANASGATGGKMAGLIQCDSYVFKHITSATDTLAVQGVASQSIYICGFHARAAGTATWFFENTASANANCSSSNTQISVLNSEVANSGIVDRSPFWSGLKSTAGNGLCINSTGTGGVDVGIYYTQF